MSKPINTPLLTHIEMVNYQKRLFLNGFFMNRDKDGLGVGECDS